MKFGGIPHPDELVSDATDIFTFTEGTDPDSTEIMLLKQQVQAAQRIVFLGFAFHVLNMRVLESENLREDIHKQCYSTAFGISKYDQQNINRQISNLFGGGVTINLSDTECNKFFNDFWRSLSFSS